MSDTSKSLLGRYGKWILLAIGLIALGAAWYFLPVKDWVKAFNGWVEQSGAFGYVIFIVAYAIATVLFFPGSLMTIGAGLAFGLWRGFAVVSVGSTLGASLSFLLARYFVRSRVQAAAPVRGSGCFSAPDWSPRLSLRSGFPVSQKTPSRKRSKHPPSRGLSPRGNNIRIP